MEMRELLYLSNRKLSQFQVEGRKRTFLRRLTGVGATAPFSMGGVNLTLAQEAQKSPDLQAVIDALEDRSRPVQWYLADDLEVGDWVTFEAKLNWGQLDLGRRPVNGEPDFGNLLLLWEPLENSRGIDSKSRVVLLHGSADGLVGAGPPVNEDRSVGYGSDARYVLRAAEKMLHDREGERHLEGSQSAARAVQRTIRHMQRTFPAFLACWLAGHARVTGILPPTANGTTYVLATPLYVERVEAAED